MSHSQEIRAEKVKRSHAFGKARNRAEALAHDPDKVRELLGQAASKAERKRGAIGTLWGRLTATLRLLKAWANGSYREIPASALLMLLASLIYFVMPIDVVPDFLLGFGYFDDVALLAWVIKKFAAHIDAFIDWETGHEN